MSLLQNARAYFRARRIKKQLEKQSSFLKKRVNINSAKNIGILFDATRLDTRQAALQYADQLKKQRKKVKLLGYFDVKQSKDASHAFPFFDKKHLDWYFIPRSKEIDFFLQQNFDIFVFLNPISSHYSEYIAALTKASLKVGPISSELDCYDLMLDVKNKATLTDFIKQLQLVLQKTNQEHEAA
ncbi:MAG TPA: hypothetical protein VJ953_19630 [Saprospiraceae bacterium]|nr:hypothetical protein [Saprospiraceae bacterium]